MYAVLNTAELLEDILSYLNIYELTLIRRVCKHWAETIQHAPKLRKITFRPVYYNYASSERRIVFHPTFVDNDWVTWDNYNIQIRAAALQPSFEPKTSNTYSYDWKRPEMPDNAVQYWIRRHKAAGRTHPWSSCWDSLATYPPTNRLRLRVAIASIGLELPSSRRGEPDLVFRLSTDNYITVVGVEGGEGVKVGDVVLEIRAALARYDPMKIQNGIRQFVRSRA